MSAIFEGPNDREPEEYICECEPGEGESFRLCDRCRAAYETEARREHQPNEEADIDF
jgi:hypothetical protein